MAGNLQVFIGQEKLNSYGAVLHGPLNELTWLLRIVLIVAVVLHVTMAVQLTAPIGGGAADRISHEASRRSRRSRRGR